jgi:hypothetical protein
MEQVIIAEKKFCRRPTRRGKQEYTSSSRAICGMGFSVRGAQ